MPGLGVTNLSISNAKLQNEEMKKSPKPNKDKTQSKLEDFLNTPSAGKAVGIVNVKKRTPPSPTDVISKRLINMSQECDNKENTEVEDSSTSADDTASEHSDVEKFFLGSESVTTHDDTSKGKLDARLKRMERRIRLLPRLYHTGSRHFRHKTGKP